MADTVGQADRGTEAILLLKGDRGYALLACGAAYQGKADFLVTDIARRISGAVEARREAIIATLCDLVRVNTVNPYSGGKILGSEKPGQLYLEPRFRKLGARTTLQAVPADVFERAGIIGPRPRDFTDRPNLVAEFDFGPAGPHVLVFAHMDTVAADDMTVAPFEATRRDGRVYGRGASDDKSSLTMAYHAAETLVGLGLPLCGRLTVASVVEEECNGGGAGIMALMLSGCRPDVCICADGQSGFVGRGCSGVVTGNVKVPGRAAHAASPDGVSALEKALVVKSALDRFKASRERERPMGLLNIGVFRAGVHPAVVPGSAEMEFNVVYFLDEAAEAKRAGRGFSAALLRDEMGRAVAEAAAGDEFLAAHRPELTWVKDLPPFETRADSPLLAGLCSAFEEVSGSAARVDTMNGWSDGSHVALMAGCEVVNFGCGAPGAAHSAGEYVEEETVVRNTKVLALWLAQALSPELLR